MCRIEVISQPDHEDYTRNVPWCLAQDAFSLYMYQTMLIEYDTVTNLFVVGGSSSVLLSQSKHREVCSQTHFHLVQKAIF